MSTLPTPRPWALGWLADREYFIELGRQLNLCKGPAADNPIRLEGAALDYVICDTWWPNLMECVVDGSRETVFAVYVDYKRRPYPPSSIPCSDLLPRKYCTRLEQFMPLDDDPQWFTCTDGSYTPWRYGGQEPGPRTRWMDVSRYQPHPDAEYDRIESLEEDDDEYYEEGPESEAMDVGEDGQEFFDDLVEEEDDRFVGEGYATEGGDPMNAELDAALVEDDDSVTVRGDCEDGDEIAVANDKVDDSLDNVDDIAPPVTIAGDVSDGLTSALGAVTL